MFIHLTHTHTHTYTHTHTHTKLYYIAFSHVLFKFNF